MKLNETAANWLKGNDACEPGYKWAARECTNIREILATAKPDWAVWTYTRPGILTDRELWLFACDCAERALPHWYAFAPDDHRPRTAIETLRKWLDGKATYQELAAAGAAAGDAARAAAGAAEEAKQAAWLRENTTPTCPDE